MLEGLQPAQGLARHQQAPPPGLHPAAGLAPAQMAFFAHPATFGYWQQAQMAAGRRSEGLGPRDGPLSPQPAQNHGQPSMDGLKARVMEAAPGQVRGIIENSPLKPRAAAFTSLIQLAAKAKQPDKAVEIFDAMSSAGVTPNTFSYSALISALARAGRWQEAERYFAQLLAKAAGDPEMAPNTVTYSAVISAYEKGGQLERALEAFQRQLAAGVPPDLITYSSLISACERAGRVDQAAELLDQLHGAGLVGNHQLYHGLLQACQSAQRWELAVEVFLGMQCASLRPTPHTVSLLLGALCAAGQAGQALFLLREALRMRYELRPGDFNSVLQLLADRGDWERALGVHRAMTLAGLHPDAATAGLVVSACTQGGNRHLAERLAAELGARQPAPPPPPPPPEGQPKRQPQQRQQQLEQQQQGEEEALPLPLPLSLSPEKPPPARQPPPLPAAAQQQQQEDGLQAQHEWLHKQPPVGACTLDGYISAQSDSLVSTCSASDNNLAGLGGRSADSHNHNHLAGMSGRSADHGGERREAAKVPAELVS